MTTTPYCLSCNRTLPEGATLCIACRRSSDRGAIPPMLVMAAVAAAFVVMGMLTLDLRLCLTAATLAGVAALAGAVAHVRS